MSAWPGDPWGAQPCGPTACTSMPQPGGPPAAAAPVWPSLARHDGAPLQPDACAAGAPPGEELLEGIGGLAQFLQSHGGGLRRPGFRLPPLVPGALSPAGSAGLEGSAQLPLHGAGSADLGRWGSLEHPSPASVACAGQAPVAVAVPAPWLAGAASGSGAGAGAALWDVDLDLDALLGSGALDLDIDFGELLGAADAGAAAAAGVPAQSAGQAVSSGACYSTQPTRTQTAGGGRRGGRTAGAQAGGGRTPCGESSKRFRERRVGGRASLEGLCVACNALCSTAAAGQAGTGLAICQGSDTFLPGLCSSYDRPLDALWPLGGRAAGTQAWHPQPNSPHRLATPRRGPRRRRCRRSWRRRRRQWSRSAPP